MTQLTNEERAANQNAINALKPSMIEQAKKLVQGRRIPDKQQFTSLVEAGGQADCAEELILFIQYKNAKEGSRTGWSELAKPLTDEIKALQEKASKLKGNPDENYLQLARLFLGYLMWAASVKLEDERQRRRQGRR